MEDWSQEKKRFLHRRWGIFAKQTGRRAALHCSLWQNQAEPDKLIRVVVVSGVFSNLDSIRSHNRITPFFDRRRRDRARFAVPYPKNASMRE